MHLTYGVGKEAQEETSSGAGSHQEEENKERQGVYRRASLVEKNNNKLINKDYNVLIHYRNGTEHLGLVVLINKSRGCLIINYVNTEFNYVLYVFYHKDYG